MSGLDFGDFASYAVRRSFAQVDGARTFAKNRQDLAYISDLVSLCGSEHEIEVVRMFVCPVKVANVVQDMATKISGLYGDHLCPAQESTVKRRVQS